MNTTTAHANTNPTAFQTNVRPLKGALIHAAQLKLLLRRGRAEELSWQKRRCLEKLLDTVELIFRSLEALLRAESRGTDLSEIEKLDFFNTDTVAAGAMQ